MVNGCFQHEPSTLISSSHFTSDSGTPHFSSRFNAHSTFSDLFHANRSQRNFRRNSELILIRFLHHSLVSFSTNSSGLFRFLKNGPQYDSQNSTQSEDLVWSNPKTWPELCACLIDESTTQPSSPKWLETYDINKKKVDKERSFTTLSKGNTIYSKPHVFAN